MLWHGRLTLEISERTGEEENQVLREEISPSYPSLILLSCAYRKVNESSLLFSHSHESDRLYLSFPIDLIRDKDLEVHV